ncbi:MAG: hypothetical protein IMZ46_05865 [Acidobacteria bacterium]|nr:hypothetical protein [Acidobacteriota bacterium]
MHDDSRLVVDNPKKLPPSRRQLSADNPFMFLDAAMIKSLSWKPKLTIREGIIRTLDYLGAHSWGLEERA